MLKDAILQNKTAAIVTSIEMSAVKFLNIMALHRFIEAGIARSANEPQPDISSAQASVASGA